MNEPDDLNAEERQRFRALLDQGADRLDTRTAHRLAQLRAAALRGERTGRPQRPWFIPAMGAAVAASIVAVVALQIMHRPEPGLPEVATVDMELLLAKDALDFYGDLDFYVWLEDENGES